MDVVINSLLMFSTQVSYCTYNVGGRRTCWPEFSLAFHICHAREQNAGGNYNVLDTVLKAFCSSLIKNTSD